MVRSIGSRSQGLWSCPCLGMGDTTGGHTWGDVLDRVWDDTVVA